MGLHESEGVERVPRAHDDRGARDVLPGHRADREVEGTAEQAEQVVVGEQGDEAGSQQDGGEPSRPLAGECPCCRGQVSV